MGTQEEIMQIAAQALESSKSAHKRIDELDADIKSISSIPVALGRLDERMGSLEKKMDKVDSTVSTINNRPLETWTEIKYLIVGAIIAGVFGLIFDLIKSIK